MVKESAGAGGSIDPTGNLLANHSTQQGLSTTTDTSHDIVDAQVDGISVCAINSYTFIRVVANHAVEGKN